MNRISISPLRIPTLLLFLAITACADKAENAERPDQERQETSLTYSWSSDGSDDSKDKSTIANGLTESAEEKEISYAVTAGSSYAVTSQGSSQPSASPPPLETSSEPAAFIKIPEKIIKTADMNFRVEDYKKARASIERIVKQANGYIASENEQNNNYSISNYMVIRVQNKDFDALVTNLTGVAKEVNQKTISTRDVTAQFVDIQARLKTKKEIEKRYIDLLQKATKIQDILDIEEKIRVLREEIEAKEGELKYLADQVAYSTINLNFYQTYEFEPANGPGFWNRLASSMGGGWKGFLNFVVGFAGLWPLWLVLGIVGYIVYRYVRRQLKRA